MASERSSRVSCVRVASGVTDLLGVTDRTESMLDANRLLIFVMPMFFLVHRLKSSNYPHGKCGKAIYTSGNVVGRPVPAKTL